MNIVVGSDSELLFHDGTVRDLMFMQDASTRSSVLISGGAGNCKICVTDCETGTPIRMMTGHTGTTEARLSVYYKFTFNWWMFCCCNVVINGLSASLKMLWTFLFDTYVITYKAIHTYEKYPI